MEELGRRSLRINRVLISLPPSSSLARKDLCEDGEKEEPQPDREFRKVTWRNPSASLELGGEEARRGGSGEGLAGARVPVGLLDTGIPLPSKPGCCRSLDTAKSGSDRRQKGQTGGPVGSPPQL